MSRSPHGPVLLKFSAKVFGPPLELEDKKNVYIGPS